MPKTAKNLINGIIDELAKDERIAELYNLWYEQKENVIRTYQDTMPQRIPLSANKEFTTIKNAVIQEALAVYGADATGWRLGWRLKMSVFEDIKNGLLQAITFEKERKAIRSHFERSKKDIKDGRVLLAEEAIESVADELISFSCLNENGRGRSQTTTGTKKK